MRIRRACAMTTAAVWFGLACNQFAGADGCTLISALNESHTPVALSVLCVMWLAGDHEMSDNARYGFDALAVSSLVCAGVKSIARQPRPDDPAAKCGFPSGHSTSAFTFARTISHQYPETAPYVYAYAAATAWARVEVDRHDWPQVVTGALLGTWIANESLHRDGGLMFGLIAPDQRPGAEAAATVSVTW